MKKVLKIYLKYDVGKKKKKLSINRDPKRHLFILRTELNKFQFETIQVTTTTYETSNFPP